MATKRGHIDIDPDYEDVTQAQTKRQKILEEDAKETTRKKIDLIVRKEFHQEIKNKEKELDHIDQSLRLSQMMMDRLRACIIANYYGAASQQRYVKGDPQQSAPIHPAVKDTLGKRPLNITVKVEPKTEGDSTERLIMKQEPQEVKEEDRMIKEEPSVGGITSRSDRFKVKKRIVIGNVSKYIPVDRRDENDQSTHKWMVYVRGPKGEPNIDHFVKKVWFFLHPSYRPNDLVEVSQPPFHLTRRGWGEFPVRVQLYFKDSRNKKVDVIHQLKLDRTYTGLQTLGSETVIDIELEKEIELKSSNRVICNGSSTLVGKESNVTIPEHKSPVKKEFKHEQISPTSTESKTPNKNLNKSKNISQFSPSSKLPNMTLTLGTLGSLTSHSINKSGTVEAGQNKAPINGLKQETVHSSASVADGSGSKHSSELQKMLLQNTPPCVTKTSASTGNVQLTHIVQVPRGAKTGNTSTVNSASAGKANSQPAKSLPKSSTCVSPPGIRPPTANQISVPPNQMTLSSATPGTGNPAQTLYIRCKDNQGNIFLVPHHLLKTVPGTQVPGQPVNNQAAKRTVPSPQTTPTKGTPQKLGHTQSPSIAVVNTPTNTVSSSPSKTQTSTVTVKPVVQNQTVPQQSVGAKSVFQKPVVQNSQLLIRSPIPVSKSNLAPVPGTPSPVLLIKTEVNPVRPLLTIGQPTKVMDKKGKEMSQPSQLQLHLQGQICQNQLKVTSQGLKSVQPAGKSKVSKKVETLTLIQKTDSNVENKIPSKTCQLASLLRGDISAAHRNAVKQMSLVTGANTMSAQVLTSQSTTQNVLVPATVGSLKDTPSSGVEIKPTIVKNSGDASTSGNQGVKMQQTPVNVLPQAIPVSVTPKTMHSVILINEDTKKVPGIQLPSKTISGGVSTQCSETVMLTSSVQTTAARVSPSTHLTNASVNFTKQQVSRTSDISAGQVPGSKEQMKTVIAKIGMQTLLLQLPVSDSGAVNKPPEVSKVNKPAPKKGETPSNAALIESLKKQAVEKEKKLKEAAKLSYMDRKLGLPIKKADSQEKRIHKWKKKTPEEKLLSFSKRLLQDDPEPVKDIDPLHVENYPDVQSLVRAAVKRHPIVSSSANIHQHPYCAKTLEMWLEWNVGKRRASEWQRAVACQKYLKKLLNGDQFKGNQLWSVKQIVCWCRLHAYSPHYMEKTLHPTGVEFPMKNMRMGERFSSATDSYDCVVEVNQINSKLRRESCSEDEVDIVSNEPPKPRIKLEVQKEIIEPEDPVILPASANARFVQDLTQKIGVKYEPSPVLGDVYGSVSEDIVFKAMLGFMEELITEAFSLKVNMGRYPDGIGVTDVYNALSILPQADFLSNKHLGVKDITR